MEKNIKEVVNVPFVTSTDSNTTIYQYSPAADMMFTPQIMESTSYPIYLDFSEDMSPVSYNTYFEWPYSLRSNGTKDVFMPAGSSWTFWTLPLREASSGYFSFQFTPAALSKSVFNVPANSGSQSRTLLTTFVPSTYSSSGLRLISANGLPLKAEIVDEAESVIGSYDYALMDDVLDATWHLNGVTLSPGKSYRIYLTNVSQSGNELSGYYDLSLYLSETDSVAYTLPADNVAHTIYTRVTPGEEVISSIVLSAASALPVTLQIQNDMTIIEHEFTAVGEKWLPESDFYLPFGGAYPFMLTNGTAPLTPVNGKFDILFTPHNNMMGKE